MKARLLGLLFLCIGFFFALSLMVAGEAAPLPDSAYAYQPSMAMALPASPPPDGREADRDLVVGEIEADTVSDMAGDGLGFSSPQQRSPYYEQAYYAFHFSDEAG